ncbi:GNAT family protein [Kitasatospora sp. NPDC047058]|uniref:GNAT family N-acetyltransferase n=1 Tax=Kitasatospora sp. NPDC047058 TaxID=3155620 RepID=UPI00341032B0
MFAIPLADNADLRPLEPWQAAEFLANMDRAREHMSPWITWADRSTDLESARATLQGYADRQATDSARLYGIWQDGTLVGGTMFVSFSAATGVAEIGVWTEPAGEGRGLVAAAVRHLIDYAFTTRGLHRIEWHTTPANVRSRSLAQRLGLTLDGTLRETYKINGEYRDSEIWSILAREWKPSA